MQADQLAVAEQKVTKQLMESGIYLLDRSIASFASGNKLSMLLAVSNMQTSMELLIKSYICRLYRFEDILLPKSQRLRSSNQALYLQDLSAGRVKTAGFEELKQFLRKQDDVFSPVIDKGCCPCFGVAYEYLEGCFQRFQAIRNAFFHLGIEASDTDSRWLESDFFCMLSVFISLLLREIGRLDGSASYVPSVYANSAFPEEMANLWETPMDILKRHLPASTISALRRNRLFMDSLYDFAADAYQADGYRCSCCGEETLFLDVYDGFSKCVSCGECFMAAYADCPACQREHTVIFDHLNIKINGNVMPGFCFHCAKHPKVYQCPVCGLAYSYSSQQPIQEFHFSCCQAHFQDRPIQACHDC